MVCYLVDMPRRRHGIRHLTRQTTVRVDPVRRRQFGCVGPVGGRSSGVLTVNQLLVFLPAAALVSLSPGPNNLLAFRNGMRTGSRSAIAAVLGRLVAFTGMLTLVVTGLSAVLTTSQLAFVILKWVGAAYLVGIGLHIIWAHRRTQSASPAAEGSFPGRPASGWTLARQEFITAAANPKALLVFTAFLPQFVHPAAGHSTAQLAALGVVYLAVELAAATMWIVGGLWLGQRRLPQDAIRRLNRGFGVVFVGLGSSLALSSPQR